MCRSVWIRNSLSWLAGKGAQASLPGLLCPELLYWASLAGLLWKPRCPFRKTATLLVEGWPLRESSDSVCPALWTSEVLEQQDSIDAERGLAVAFF